MSDNELDAELLALAGGDESSSEDEGVAPPSPPKKDEPKKSIEKSPPRRGVAQKLKSRAKARRRRDESEDEDDFGGSSESEAAPVGPRSPSADAEGDLDDEAPLYPIEGKFRSEADRQDIMGMTEIEREEILAERAAEAQRRAQDQQLKRLLQARKRDEDGEGRKRKAGAAELDDGQRKSSRQKTTAKSKIEEYKRQRELKGAARARGEERRREERSPTGEDDYSERDADGESEVEFDEGRRASPPQKEESPPELHDFNNVRVGRTNFAKYCFYPTFEPLIKGCYVRVNVGMESSGLKYRVGQIKSFRESRPYTLEAPNGKKIYTNQTAVVAFGKTEKDFPFAACSDSKISESEFSEFRSILSNDGIRFPTRRYIKAKTEDIQALVKHSFTDQDIENKVAKANSMRKVHDDFQRDRIVRRRDEAASRGDDDTVARCNRDLAAFNAGGPVVKNGSPAKKEDQQSRLAALNKANRKSNSEEIRKALVAEKMAQNKARAAAAAKFKEEEERKKAEAAAAAQNGGGLKVPGMDDLFGEGSDISRAGTPVNGTPKKGRSRAGTPMNGLREKKSFGQFAKKKLEDEVIGGLDLGIDIDI